MATIQELEQAGAKALAANNQDAAQYFANEIKSLSSAGLNAEAEIQQEPEGLIETTNFVANDIANQFLNNTARFLGGPIDLISLGLNKVSNAIVDQDIVPEDAFEGGSVRKILQFLTSTIN